MGKDSVILPVRKVQSSTYPSVLRRINNFFSFFSKGVTFLNNLLANFVNKFFFISKSDIDNKFKTIVCCLILFGGIALCTGCFSFTFIIPCFILFGFIKFNNYNTIRRKVVDRLYLFVNIGILTFITGLILYITACLFIVVSGVHLE